MDTLWKENISLIHGEYLTMREIEQKYNVPYSTLKTRYTQGKRGLELLISKNHSPNYWAKEKCFELAFTCKNASDFQKKFGSAYHASSVNKWLKEIKYNKQIQII